MRKIILGFVSFAAVVFVTLVGVAFHSFVNPNPTPASELTEEVAVTEEVAPLEESSIPTAEALPEFDVQSLTDGLTGFIEGLFPTAEALPSGSTSSLTVAGYPVRVGEFTMNDDGYSASYFGGWASTGGGCDIRDAVLERDLTNKKQNGCDMRAGNLVDPYVNQSVYWESGNRAVDVDHVVSRSNAWSAGAMNWTEAQLVEFSNDMSNLLATDQKVNKWKSDRLPADILANGGYTAEGKCVYIEIYARTVSKYDLMVPQADVNAMNNEWSANSCSN